MNYLAHLYLGRHSPELLLGSMLGDFVKGAVPGDLHPEIRTGIIVHRSIDKFTDSHPIFLRSRERLHPTYRRYSAILVDLFYDHFLALQWQRYHPHPLDRFAAEVYAVLETHRAQLPTRLQSILDPMQRKNWLLSYTETENIERAARGIASRLRRPTPLAAGAVELARQYQGFSEDFSAFWPVLVTFADRQLTAHSVSRS